MTSSVVLCLMPCEGCWVRGKHEWSAHLAYQMLDVPAGDINTVSLMKEKTMQELTEQS